MTTWRRGEYSITDSRSRIDIDAVHRFLASSYWAEGIPRSLVAKAIRNSLCFGLLHRAAQVGFARVVTDGATFGYLADVYVEDAHRGKGLSKWLLFGHSKLQGFRRWVLVTKDAHGLYEKNGFGPLARPSTYMEKWDRDVYRRQTRAQP